MKKLTAIFLFFVTITSCTSTHKTSSDSASTYWSKEPDIGNVIYLGGDGKSPENAVVIKNAKNERNGVAAEYDYIAKKLGVKFVDWKPMGQSTITQAGRKIDLVKIQVIKTDEIISYYFDISEFYGKF